MTAAETKEYLGAEFQTEVEVIETSPVSAGGAGAHIIYSLGEGDCEAVKYITGAGSVDIPQSCLRYA